VVYSWVWKFREIKEFKKLISYLANQTIITNLDYSTIDKVIKVFEKTFKKLGKIVNVESNLLTSMCWRVILKNKSREFVTFKIYINTPTNYTLKIKKINSLDEKNGLKLEKEVNQILKTLVIKFD
jgi:hypothetical protein